MFYSQQSTSKTAISAWKIHKSLLCAGSARNGNRFQSFQLILTRTEKPFKVNLTSGEYCAISSKDEIRVKSISIASKGNNRAAAEKILEI